MQDWFDKEQLWCRDCGHKWLLISNKEITDEQHRVWIEAVIKHHNLILNEKEE